MRVDKKTAARKRAAEVINREENAQKGVDVNTSNAQEVETFIAIFKDENYFSPINNVFFNIAMAILLRRQGFGFAKGTGRIPLSGSIFQKKWNTIYFIKSNAYNFFLQRTT